MCITNVIVIEMANRHVNVLDGIYGAGELDVSTPDELEVSDTDTDVFKGLDLDCSSELSSPSNDESEGSKTPERQVRKHLVIGKHIEVTEGEQRKYKCTICNCQFSWKQQIRYHDYCATGKRPLKCELCEERFVKKSHFVYHMRTHTGESPFKCSLCLKTFKQRDKLKRHEKTHKELGGNVEKFTCGTCRKDYSDRDSLKKHQLKHGKTRKIKCKSCNKRYADKFTLKQHMAVHQYPKFICDVCGKKFHRRNSLNVHLQMHEDVYPHQCSECRKTFRTKKELTQHSVVHDKNNRGFECSICSIMCGRKDNLLRHVRNCHLDPCAKKEQKKKADDLKHNDEMEQKKSKSIDVVGDDEGLAETLQTNSDHIARSIIDEHDEDRSKGTENEVNNIVAHEYDEDPAMDNTVYKNPVDTAILERKSVLVPSSERLTEAPVDLSQGDASTSRIEQYKVLSAQTSVIVHTSSLLEPPIYEKNFHREPVIKFLGLSKENESLVPDTL